MELPGKSPQGGLDKFFPFSVVHGAQGEEKKKRAKTFGGLS